MRVHVFGNSPSPAVATYGLRKSVELGPVPSEVKQFVERDFYVDDGLISLPTVDKAVNLMKSTQKVLLANGNMRLHKITSNNDRVMNAFPTDDLAKDLKDLDLGVDSLPQQCSLGLIWDLETDTFGFQVCTEEKPFTKWGILSTINSLFDPIGFVAPVDLHIPHTYIPVSLEAVKKREVHIFSDASEQAIAAVAYLKTTYHEENHHLGFLLGKAKVAPRSGHTIPRLELCAAVLAVDIAELLSKQLDIPLNDFHYYTDSRIILGYIHNQTRRCYVYISNQVQRIRQSSKSEQWRYVSTNSNPADQATRSVHASLMYSCDWLNGPSHLLRIGKTGEKTYPLLEPESDKDVRPLVIPLATTVKETFGLHRFERFSSWKRLLETIAHLKQIARNLHEKKVTNLNYKNVNSYAEGEQFIIRTVQKEIYSRELNCLKRNEPLPKVSSIVNLCPFIDESGLLRVGGRLNRAELTVGERNPLIIPGHGHIATLLVWHFHEAVKHQGHHFTEGAVRSAGYWITGGKKLISPLIYKCVKCRKLRCLIFPLII
ncbi:uncharacterized protein LOC121381553 [Gigantopelta aegis]|uniref:uncharacterized protein LOC121381553 n=1 Tax=Gigantopelta aegis TaxID=1735272 RepID=UPI001B88E328|nr:uncharacterized protein LOC121381553 [Gigantopelta aegis]